MACSLSFIVKSERVLKVTGSHDHFKSGNRPYLENGTTCQ